MVKRLMLLILLMLFTTAAYAAQEDSFSAKLRIDNKVEMKWTVSDNDAVYVKIYGTDEGGENYVPVEERLPAADSGYMFDFIARGVDYSDFYTFVTLGADGGEIASKTVSTETGRPSSYRTDTGFEGILVFYNDDFIVNFVSSTSGTNPAPMP